MSGLKNELAIIINDYMKSDQMDGTENQVR